MFFFYFQLKQHFNWTFSAKRSTHKLRLNLADVPSKLHCQAVDHNYQIPPPFYRLLGRTVPSRSVLGMESIFPGSQQTLSTTDEDDDDGEERASDFHFIFECSHILYELSREEGVVLVQGWRRLNIWTFTTRFRGWRGEFPPFWRGTGERGCEDSASRGRFHAGSRYWSEEILASSSWEGVFEIWRSDFMEYWISRLHLIWGLFCEGGDPFANRMRVNLKLWKIRRSDEDAAIAADLKRQ